MLQNRPWDPLGAPPGTLGGANHDFDRFRGRFWHPVGEPTPTLEHPEDTLERPKGRPRAVRSRKKCLPGPHQKRGTKKAPKKFLKTSEKFFKAPKKRLTQNTTQTEPFVPRGVQLVKGSASCRRPFCECTGEFFDVPYFIF